MSTPTTSRKRGPSDKTKTAARQKTTARQKTAAATKSAPAKATAGTTAQDSRAMAKTGKPAKSEAGDGKRSVTITVPTMGRMAGGLMDAALLPVAVARRWLPAKGGLPLYVGLGVLGAADAIEWPVAVGIGVGYAVLRRGGVMAPPSTGGRTVAQTA